MPDRSVDVLCYLPHNLPPDHRQVKHLRGMDTWFLSAQECMLAGSLQAKHPNPCRLAPSGFYGSKFVTVVVSGERGVRRKRWGGG